MVEEPADGDTAVRTTAAGARVATPQRSAEPIAKVGADDGTRLVSGIGELDRVLGGGMVPGSVTLLGGEPGAGKSTLVLQLAQALAERGAAVLYVSAEESLGQVRLRAERLGALHEGLLAASEVDLPTILGLIEAHKPQLCVVDSIQTVADPEATGIPGGVGQVRDCASALVRTAKQAGMACVLIGHVTKEGQLAGPRTLEHLVDTVCDVAGERHDALRLLRAAKNRYGPVGEVGCFEMGHAGLSGIADPGRLFVGETAAGTTGVAVTLTLEGQRPLAAELQALVADSELANPRRVASGLDGQRLGLLAAVCERRAGVAVAGKDVYVSTVGGLRLTEPAVDAALCLALASSRWEIPVQPGAIAIGEVGLAGELRLVAQTERRLAEAARLGFHRAVLPAAYDGPSRGLTLHRAPDLATALETGLGG
jgi:DNA repair protein RadA/Sms